MNQPIDADSVVRVQGKVPGRAEAVTLVKMKKESRFTARVSQQDFEDFKKISAKKSIQI